mmetsp:Transcript_23699/g.68119  ORF Transcript_23699/g.68119 Transcript_23699/m.68119 type:complete len:448 (+) Transcript_23699:1375-2718(+)
MSIVYRGVRLAPMNVAVVQQAADAPARYRAHDAAIRQHDELRRDAAPADRVALHGVDAFAGARLRGPPLTVDLREHFLDCIDRDPNPWRRIVSVSAPMDLPVVPEGASKQLAARLQEDAVVGVEAEWRRAVAPESLEADHGKGAHEGLRLLGPPDAFELSSDLLLGGEPQPTALASLRPCDVAIVLHRAHIVCASQLRDDLAVGAHAKLRGLEVASLSRAVDHLVYVPPGVLFLGPPPTLQSGKDVGVQVDRHPNLPEVPRDLAARYFADGAAAIQIRVDVVVLRHGERGRLDVPSRHHRVGEDEDMHAGAILLRPCRALELGADIVDAGVLVDGVPDVAAVPVELAVPALCFRVQAVVRALKVDADADVGHGGDLGMNLRRPLQHAICDPELPQAWDLCRRPEALARMHTTGFRNPCTDADNTACKDLGREPPDHSFDGHLWGNRA